MTIFVMATVRRRGFFVFDVCVSGGVGVCILFVVGICGGGIGLWLIFLLLFEEKLFNVAAKLSFFAFSNFAGEIFLILILDLVFVLLKFVDGDLNIFIGGDGGWSVVIGEVLGNVCVVVVSALIFAYSAN